MKPRAWIAAGAVVIAGGGVGAAVATSGSPAHRAASSPAHRTTPSTTTSTTTPLQELAPEAEAAGNGPPPTSAQFCAGSLAADQASPRYPASYPLVNGQTCFDELGSFVHLGRFPARTTAPEILRNGGWFRIS